MFKKTNSVVVAVLAALGSMMAVPAFAAIDTASITAGITDASTAVGVIGAAVVLIYVGIKVYKWIRGAL